MYKMYGTVYLTWTCSTTQLAPSKDLCARANQEISTSAADTISTGPRLGGGGGREDLDV